MRLKAMLKMNFKELLPGFYGFIIALLIVDFLMPVIGYFFGQGWPSEKTLESSLAFGMLEMMFFIMLAFVFFRNIARFAQFNVARKDQYWGNFLTIVISAVVTVIAFQVIYPLILSVAFENLTTMKVMHFYDNEGINIVLHHLRTILTLISTGLGAWIVATLFKRFQTRYIVILGILLFIILPIILGISAVAIPETILTPIINKVVELYKQPIPHFTYLVCDVLFTAILAKLFSRNLEVK
ncbi:hypothetical protein G7081_05335 [Vagococcus coleopterorum]|uniref:Uncharacterized protein n=1 Tax=Vagococcus coleopterorum TaxID=2714946 RepID=A0A6G8ANF9_9ENTE|nr:hypothetical protein [Vagococcus coleopterorum]QIL46536.1 hypothetical protein G7081_05335 [Vagococcus coleopterorum]